MNLPVYNCIIDENLSDETGVYAISFVDCPANEVDFITLSRQKNEHLNRDTKKQILTGVVLKPEQLIYRNSPELGDYYIKFSAGQIEKIAQKMMRSGLALHNTTHQHQSPLEGNYLVELWIVTDPDSDKSKALGFENLPQGTLMCSYKISDREYWNNQVMTGNVRGFSLEGLFTQQIDKPNPKQLNQKCRKMNKKKPTLLGKIMNFLLDIEAVKKVDITQSGEAFVVFVLADGKEVYVDQDGFATLDDEQMPAGEHKLADGNLLVIDNEGQFVETKEPSAKTKNPDEAKAPDTLSKNKRKGHKLADFEPKTMEALKAKIAEMQTTIDQLSQSLTDAQGMLEQTQGQVEELRRKTPSTRPAVQPAAMYKTSDEMTTAERMAMALSQTIQRRK